MKYIFHSKFGDSLFLALWMAKHGKDVSFYIDNEKDKDTGRNMGINIVEDFDKEIYKTTPQDTMIIFDQTGFGYKAARLKKLGFPIYAASILADKLEEDRTFATKLLSEVMNVPKTVTMNSFDEGRAFLKSKNSSDRFVFKPNGEDTPSDWTYVSRDRNDMLSQIDYYNANWNLPKVSFELQEFIEGIEVDFSGIMNVNGNWLGNGFQLYFEDKKFLDGNKGLSVGCADAIQYYTSANEPFYRDILSKFTEFLGENNFTGQFSINMLISNKDHKPYALEITPRFGYFSLQNEIHTLLSSSKDPELLLRAVALGEPLPKDYFPLGSAPYNYYPQGAKHSAIPRIAMSVGVSIPPYPNLENTSSARGKTVQFEKSIENNIYWGDIMYSKKDSQYECTGSDGVIAVCSVMGATPGNCIRKMYDDILPNIYARSIQYRMDAGKRVADDIYKLRQWKLIL